MTIKCNMQIHGSSELALPTLMFFISSNSMEKIVASLIYQNLIVLQITNCHLISGNVLIVPIVYPLKTPENLWFSDVLGGITWEHWAEMGYITPSKDIVLHIIVNSVVESM